ncbi:LacI family DNA-binding transcriptional regulator [Pseudarthrobacter phenanthrenivorans]|uniref:LacI family DNA-binding transcriptional regulator n=1 Tax=Pseudarthrobacter phenanthrenivorans TaxID=361575 RepID=A0A3B0FMR8_PSEPS|nr:LacI family DNA-binding transcriptional regulator [Pseudarthrobacter phenanthrenivorans]RKO24153.1 LacI family DNA-binding transcriptional regulator [Pseudarthrobacter phenanthrenivorans]
MATKVNIRDVAKAAGVSVTTVSHALSEAHSSRVNARTVEHIKAVAGDLGYAPNRLASGLRNQRSQILGLVSDEITTTPFAGAMIQGAQDAASEHGHLLMVVNSGLDNELERQEIRALQQHQVDGVIYARMFNQLVSVPAELGGFPTIVLDATPDNPELSSVVPDESGAGESAAELLVAAGHRRIAMINNEDDIPAAHQRLAGFREGLARHGLELPDSRLVTAHPSTAGGREAALQLLAGSERPTALFCFNDQMAMGAYQAAGHLGLGIPDDLSIVGVDNLELIADALWPGLSTMALPHYEMGRWAVLKLLNELEDPGTARMHEKIACPLVERHSVAPPRN